MNKRNFLIVLLSLVICFSLSLGFTAFADEAQTGTDKTYVSEDFKTTAVSASVAAEKKNLVGGNNASHGAISAEAWGGSVKVVTGGYLIYKVAASETAAFSTLKVTVSAQVWNQSDPNAGVNNNVKIYVSADKTNFGDAVKTISAGERVEVSEETDVSAIADGKSEIFVKVELNQQSGTAQESDGQLDLSYVGVKLYKVEIAGTEQEGEPSTLKTVKISDDYKTTAVGASSNIYEFKNLAGGNNQTHGVVPAPAWGGDVDACTGYAIYKIAVPAGAVMQSFTALIDTCNWTNTGAFPDNNIKVYLSENDSDFGEPVAVENAVDDGGARFIKYDYDWSEYANGKNVVFVKVELNHMETNVSLALCGIHLFGVDFEATYDAAQTVTTKDYSYSITRDEIIESEEITNLATMESDGTKFLCVKDGYVGNAVIKVIAPDLEEFYNLSLEMKVRCTVYLGGALYENAISVYVSGDGENYELASSFATDADWARKSVTADLSALARGNKQIYVKVVITFPSDNSNPRDWVGFGEMSFSGGTVDRKSFDIIYSGVDGAVVESPLSYTKGEETVLGSASKEHYTFDGWYKTADLTEKVESISAESVGDVTLFAKWIPDTHTVTLNGADGVFENGEHTFELRASYNSTLKKADLPVPTLENKDFIGWFKDAELTSPFVFEGDQGTADIIVEDTVIYAKYGAKISVTFKYEDGVTDDVVIYYSLSEKAVKPQNPERQGYIFACWLNGEIEYDFETELTKDVVLTAKWLRICSITYVNCENATNENPVSFNALMENITLVPAQKTGYTFDGWFNADDEQVTTIDVSVDQDIVITAKWTVKTYALTITSDEHSSVSPEDKNTITYEGETFTVTVSEGYRISLVTVNGTAVLVGKDGSFEVKHIDGDVEIAVSTVARYFFNGAFSIDYATETDFINKVYEIYNIKRYSGENRNGWLIPENYAEESYVVYAIRLDGQKTINTLKLGGIARVFTINSSKAVFTVLYSTDGESWESIAFDSTLDGGKNTVIDENLSAAAKGKNTFFIKVVMESGNYDWVSLGSLSAEIEYSKVTVTLMDGEDTIDSISVVKGERLELLEDPVKNGYVFSGWYTDAELTKEFDETTTVVKSFVLYAKFRVENYNIVYVAEDAINENPVSYTINDEIILLPVQRTGYKFAGWYTSADFTGDVVEKIAKGSFGNITLYAKFNAGFKINYELFGGTNNELNPEYYFSDETTELFDAYKDGYVFGGWYADEARTMVITEIAEGQTGELTLYAEWIEDGADDSSSGSDGSGSVDEIENCQNGCSGGIGGLGTAAFAIVSAIAVAVKRKKR